MTNDELKRAAWIAVLADDETYSGLDGCWIATTTEDQVKALDAGAAPETVIRHGSNSVSLRELLEFAIDSGFFQKDDGVVVDPMETD